VVFSAKGALSFSLVPKLRFGNGSVCETLFRHSPAPAPRRQGSNGVAKTSAFPNRSLGTRELPQARNEFASSTLKDVRESISWVPGFLINLCRVLPHAEIDQAPLALNP
jgi:hypothetical protein